MQKVRDELSTTPSSPAAKARLKEECGSEVVWKLTADVTPRYAASAHATEALAKLVPKATLIFSFRDPFSRFNSALRMGWVHRGGKHGHPMTLRYVASKKHQIKKFLESSQGKQREWIGQLGTDPTPQLIREMVSTFESQRGGGAFLPDSPRSLSSVHLLTAIRHFHPSQMILIDFTTYAGRRCETLAALLHHLCAFPEDLPPCDEEKEAHEYPKYEPGKEVEIEQSLDQVRTFLQPETRTRPLLIQALRKLGATLIDDATLDAYGEEKRG